MSSSNLQSSNSSKSSSFKDGRTQSKAPPVTMDLQERTLRVSNYGRKVTEPILRELFSQGGPVRKVVFKEQFSFIEFEDADSVAYCLALFDGIELFGDRLQLTPKINHQKAFNYLQTLNQYEQAFVHNPLEWWNRFGDPSKPCPKHICSYSANVMNYPPTNYDLYNNQMMNHQMMNHQMMNNQMMNHQMMNNQMNSYMINNHMMPTSSTFSNNFNDVDLRQTDPKLIREFDRSFNPSRSYDYNNRKNDRNDRSHKKILKYDHQLSGNKDNRHRSSKRLNTHSSNQVNKKMKAHQSF